MPDESALRVKARAVLQNGKLPARRPDHKWSDRGDGAPCTICELPVTTDELEYEIHFARDGNSIEAGLDKFNVHPRCFAIWEFERGTAGGATA
jgi:hypothetical protein